MSLSIDNTKDEADRAARRRRTWEFVASAALLAAVLWVARYAYSSAFGLYEDDFTIVPTAAQMTFRQVLAFTGNYIANLRGHARPLSDSFIYILSNIGWGLGGLRGVYLIGGVIVALNSGLFYGLLRRWYAQDVALIGGLAYVLFSADTTQAFLTHSLGLQPSLTLLLTSIHLYNGKSRPLAYVLSALILLAYETPYLVFLAAPLFDGHWDRRTLRRLGRHALIVLALLGLVAALRVRVGEERVTNLALGDAILTSSGHMLAGAAVSLGSYFLRAFQLAASGTTPAWLAFGAAWILVVPVLFLLARSGNDRGPNVEQGPSRTIWPIPWNRPLLRLVLVGCATLILAYPLTFTTRATAISGRETRVHLAAVVGASMVVGAIGAGFLRRGRTRWQRWAACTLLGGLFASLVGYGLVIQADYARAWRLQQTFWTQVVALVPDAREGTVIVVDPVGLEDTLQIGANTWNLPVILEQMFVFPSAWKSPPRVFRATPDWREYLVLPDGSFRITGDTVMASPSVYATVDRSRVMVLHSGAGDLSRRARPLVVDQVEYTLAPVGPTILPGLPRGFLYDLLVLAGPGR